MKDPWIVFGWNNVRYIRRKISNTFGRVICADYRVTYHIFIFLRIGLIFNSCLPVERGFSSSNLTLIDDISIQHTVSYRFRHLVTHRVSYRADTSAVRTVIGRESENRLHFVQGGECTTVFDLVSAKLVVNGFFTFFGDFRQKYDSFLNKHTCRGVISVLKPPPT